MQRDSLSQKFSDYGQLDCGGFDIDQTLQFKQYDADMVFFVTYTGEEYLAAAQACAFGKNDRPRFGVVLYGALISDQTNPSNDVQFEKNVETTVHECLHGLGFTDSMLNLFRDSNGNYHKTPSVTLNTLLYVSTPKVLNYTR